MTDTRRVREAADTDVTAVVDIHMATFPGFFLTSLGPRFLKAFYRGLIDCPLGVLLVAEADGRVTGFVGGTTNEAAFFTWLKQERRHDFIREASIAALRHPRSIRRLWRARRRDVAAAESAYPAVLLSIGVTPDAKNQGTGRALVTSFTRALQARGSDGFCLTTDAQENEGANSFYRSLGMSWTRTFVTPEGRRMNEYIQPSAEGT